MFEEPETVAKWTDEGYWVKHDAILDAESDIGASTMLVLFLSHMRSNENIVWLSLDSDD